MSDCDRDQNEMDKSPILLNSDNQMTLRFAITWAFLLWAHFCYNEPLLFTHTTVTKAWLYLYMCETNRLDQHTCRPFVHTSTCISCTCTSSYSSSRPISVTVWCTMVIIINWVCCAHKMIISINKAYFSHYHPTYVFWQSLEFPVRVSVKVDENFLKSKFSDN